MPKLMSKSNEDFYSFICVLGVQRTFRHKKTFEKSLALHRKCCAKCDQQMKERNNDTDANNIYVANNQNGNQKNNTTIETQQFITGMKMI